MNHFDWKNIKHFRKEEFNHPKRMAYAHVKRLDKFRDNLGSSIIITSDYRESETSMHGKGLATDIIAPKITNLFEFYLEAERFNFTGLGIYPHWQLNGNVIGGLHVDSRSPKNGRGARWICILVNGKQEYITLNQENLQRYIING